MSPAVGFDVAELMRWRVDKASVKLSGGCCWVTIPATSWVTTRGRLLNVISLPDLYLLLLFIALPAVLPGIG
jgi:hypothetical protein